MKNARQPWNQCPLDNGKGRDVEMVFSIFSLFRKSKSVNHQKARKLKSNCLSQTEELEKKKREK